MFLIRLMLCKALSHEQNAKLAGILAGYGTWFTDFKNACRQCLAALNHGDVSQVHFVHDYNDKLGKTCWSKDDIVCIIESLYLDPSSTSNLYSLEEVTIGDKYFATVEHPLFGTVSRAGWALFPSCSYENTFYIIN
jgi:hypothetical protein